MRRTKCSSAKARTERAASAVEFALILPILLLVLGGIIDFGRFMFQSAIVTQIAREGARAAVVLSPYDETQVVARAEAAGWGLEPTGITVTPPASCPAKTDITVVVTYDFEWILVGPAMKFFGGSGPSGPIKAEASMRCGG